MTRGRTVAIGAVLAILVGACAASPDDGGGTAASAAGGDSDAAAGTDASGASPAESIPPSHLVGLWRVEADGEQEGTLLQIGSGGGAEHVTLWRDCGGLLGWWVASGSSLIVDVDGMTEGCVAGGVEVAWLEQAEHFAGDGDDVLLLDRDGAVLATLTPDTGDHDPGAAAQRRGPEHPEPDPGDLQALDRTPTRPEGLVPSRQEELQGRWIPTVDAAAGAEIVIAEGGTWSGSDGCNSTGGRWRLSDDGGLLISAGAVTLMACDGMYLIPLYDARWASVDGDRLTLFDETGAVLDVAVRG